MAAVMLVMMLAATEVAAANAAANADTAHDGGGGGGGEGGGGESGSLHASIATGMRPCADGGGASSRARLRRVDPHVVAVAVGTPAEKIIMRWICKISSTTSRSIINGE